MEQDFDLDLDIIGEDGNTSMDTKKYAQTLKEVAGIDGFRDYLRETMALDIKRYFFHSKEQQDVIKGAYHRTLYLYKLLQKASKDSIDKLTT